MGPAKGPDGRYAITFPLDDKALPGIAAEDIGRCVHGIFKRGPEFIGRTVGIAGEHLTGSQMAAALSNVLGMDVGYNPVTPEAYRSLGFPGADDIGNMFQYKRDFSEEYRGARDPEVARSLNPSLQDFRTWLFEHASRIPL
jgi:NmrA-like family